MKAATIILLALLSGCGPSLVAFEVTEVKTSDCTQNASNQVQCFDPESLSIAQNIGRWTIDYTGDKFVLTTASGETMPGLHFSDNGRVISDTCIGEGGQCHFARTRVDSLDPASGCFVIEDRVIDVRVVEGVLSGTRSEVRFIEGCDQASVREVVTNVSGEVLDEPVLAREVAE